MESAKYPRHPSPLHQLSHGMKEMDLDPQESDPGVHPRLSIYWNKEAVASTFDLPIKVPLPVQEKANQISGESFRLPSGDVDLAETHPVAIKDAAEYAWGEPAKNEDLVAMLRGIDPNHPALTDPANAEIIANFTRNPGAIVSPRALRWYYNVRQRGTEGDNNTRSDLYLSALARERKRIRKTAVTKMKSLRASAVDENGMNKRERKKARLVARKAIADATICADGLTLTERNKRDRRARKLVRDSVVNEYGVTRRERLQERRLAKRVQRGERSEIRAARKELKDVVVGEDGVAKAERQRQGVELRTERMQEG